MKTNLILLHGALGSSQQLEPLQERLATDYSVYLHTFTGHGGKPIDRDFTLANLTADLQAFLETIDGPVSMVGYSMGGYVAMNYCRIYPGKVERIMTLGTKYAWSPEIAAKELKMLNAEKIAEKVPAFAAALEKRHHPTDWKAVLQHTGQMMEGLGGPDGIPADEWKISIPVLVARAEADHMVSREESEAVVQRLPQAEYVEVPASKHPIEQVNLDHLETMIRNFLS